MWISLARQGVAPFCTCGKHVHMRVTIIHTIHRGIIRIGFVSLTD